MKITWPKWTPPHVDPMNAAGTLSWLLISGGCARLMGWAAAAIVGGLMLGGWYVYLELYVPFRSSKPRGDD